MWHFYNASPAKPHYATLQEIMGSAGDGRSRYRLLSAMVSIALGGTLVMVVGTSGCSRYRAKFQSVPRLV
jgi:hypothetical protein